MKQGDRMLLADINDGQSVKITAITLCVKDKTRLFYLGIYEGNIVTRLCSAPFCDPILFWVNGMQIVLRKSEAKQMEVMEVI